MFCKKKRGDVKRRSNENIQKVVAQEYIIGFYSNRQIQTCLKEGTGYIYCMKKGVWIKIVHRQVESDFPKKGNQLSQLSQKRGSPKISANLNDFLDKGVEHDQPFIWLNDTCRIQHKHKQLFLIYEIKKKQQNI